jgi:hypothetical protein
MEVLPTIDIASTQPSCRDVINRIAPGTTCYDCAECVKLVRAFSRPG